MHGRDPSWWQGHLQRIEQEGISTKAYAQREGLDVKELYESRRNFKRRVSAPMVADNPTRVSRQFVELRPCLDSSKDTGSSDVNCCLVLPSGVRLEMSALPNTGWIAALAHELGGLGGGQR